ncbi:UDP-N-acetylglucosamine 2-epimerase [Candidatus Pelagibacter sp.]|nr:UDP-N-acetylglucosamine 2-epimerase [Candidatus Pelagibacter sp.]
MKKICTIIHNRANYGSIKSVLELLKKHKSFKLQIIVGGSANLERFGSVVNIIKKDGFKIDRKINFVVEGNSTLEMAKSTGLAIIEMSNALSDLKPDLVITVGDRYETMATAISASYMNIPLAHTMGGEVSGTIDESVRHAVTKFSSIHFAATAIAKRNIVKMGENKRYVFNVGCPRIDEVKQILKKIPSNFNKKINENGVGSFLDLNKPFITIMNHPVTTEYGNGEKEISKILKIVNKFDIQKLVFWPNPDAGSEDISRGIRKWREKFGDTKTRFFKNLEQKYFYHVLDKTICLIGNSSSGVREGSFIGVQNICIGSRQKGREIGKNTIMINNNEKKLSKLIQKILKKKTKKLRDYKYGNGSASKKIIEILKKIDFKYEKKTILLAN